MTTLVNFLAATATALMLVGGLTVLIAPLLRPGLKRSGGRSGP